jgi:hypothetical protein
MFQVEKYEVPPQGYVLIDDDIRTEFKAGLTGVTLWTPHYPDMRHITIELRVEHQEVFPASFPAELYSQNQFRDAEAGTFKCSYPPRSKVEGIISNTFTSKIDVYLILIVE